MLVLSLFIIPINSLAYSDYIIAGGENIGIELNSVGIMIVGVYQVNDNYPATEAGLKVGDVITHINQTKVTTIDEMVKNIQNVANKNNVEITYIRNHKTNTTVLKLYQDENKVYKTGLYVKDSIAGIGTLTFIDPETKLFGALGHEITEKNTGQILEIKDGKIFGSDVTGVEASRNGVPGEKNATFDYNSVFGKIKENTQQGLFGSYTTTLPDRKKYKVAQPNEIKKGEAKILTVLDGKNIQEYQIEIIKIENDASQKTKNLIFEITDKELLEKTGGIVQGMSGSPIIQGDYIIGAVTHVVVENPQKGYGIFITNMLEEAEN